MAGTMVLPCRGLADSREEGDTKGTNGFRGIRESKVVRGTKEVIPREAIGVVEVSSEMEDRGTPLRADPRGLLVAVGGLPGVGDREHGCNHGGNRIVSVEWDIIWVGMRTTPMTIRG